MNTLTPEPAPSAESQAHSRPFPWRFAVYGLLFAIYLSILIPNLRPARTIASQNACLANLKQIRGAIHSWSLEANKSLTDNVDVNEIVKYMHGGQLPTCPAGGSYILNQVKNAPTCSLAHTLGHSLK